MITRELIAYVKSELNKGKTREEIHSALSAGGGWNESDLSEVFRAAMPFEKTAFNIIQPVPPTPAGLPPLVSKPFPEISLRTEKTEKKPHKIPWVAILSAILLGGLLFVAFYFFRPQIFSLPDKAISWFDSLAVKIKDLMPKKEIPSTITEKIPKEIPKIPALIFQTPVSCGTTNALDRENSNTFLKNEVLRCLGENAKSCINAEGTINDPLFPNFFKIVNKENICKFELSYKTDSILVDIFGKKLAGQSVSCPLSIVKIMDETNPKNLVFKAVEMSNPNKYAADIYFYGTLGLFIENNFDQNRIEDLGCSGTFVNSVIESYNLTKSKI